MTLPAVDLNWIAIIVAVVAAFAIGTVWYAVLFRDAWAKAMGFSGWQPTSSDMMRGGFINIVGTLLMAYVLAQWIASWRPSVWGGAGADGSPVGIAAIIGLWAWAGFIVPVLANQVAYERKTWAAFAINAGCQLVQVAAMALILAFWR